MFTEGLATSSDDRRKAAEFGDPAPAVGFFPANRGTHKSSGNSPSIKSTYSYPSIPTLLCPFYTCLTTIHRSYVNASRVRTKWDLHSKLSPLLYYTIPTSLISSSIRSDPCHPPTPCHTTCTTASKPRTIISVLRPMTFMVTMVEMSITPLPCARYPQASNGLRPLLARTTPSPRHRNITLPHQFLNHPCLYLHTPLAL